MRNLPISILICLLFLVTVSAAQDLNTGLQRASALEAEGKLEQAVEIYRTLYDQYPRRIDILYRLEPLLSKIGRHAEAADLLRERLKTAPGDLTARLHLGDALYDLGQPEAAFEQWEYLLGGTPNAGTFTLVADRYRKRTLYDRASDTYRKARAALNSPRLFARELAELAERRANYPEAILEHLNFLQDQPQYLPLIESRIREFAREGDQSEAVFTLLDREVRQHPEDRIRQQFLIEYALPAGYAGRALQTLTHARPDVQALLRIAASTLEGADYATAAAAYATLLDRTDARAHHPSALLGLARAQAGRDSTQTARTRYTELIRDYPDRPEADEARFRLGTLDRAENDLHAALDKFSALASGPRHTPWRTRALFELADLHFRADRIDDARSACTRIVQERAGQEDADEARFKLAELAFFTRDFQHAQNLLAGLLAGPPNRYTLNDALDLSVLIQEALRDAPDALEAYARAVKQQRQNRPEDALHALDAFLEAHPDAPFIDRALAARIEILDALGRYPEAIGACRRLIEQTPWSPRAPWAQFFLGHIYETRMGQYYDARNTYETLLIDYPRSLEADDARSRLRALLKKIQTLESPRKETG